MVTKNNKYDEYGFRINPKKDTPKKKPQQVKDQDNKSKRRTVYLVIGFIILIGCIICSILSGFIAWNCYANNLKQIRIFKTILASIFFYLYLPYFFLLRVILQQGCF